MRYKRERVLSVPEHLKGPPVNGGTLMMYPHKLIELHNGLRAVLISKPDIVKAAVAMNIGNGAFTDPFEEENEAKNPKKLHLPGLAHFCEHMLFLGTKKYPKENEFQRYVQLHAGSHNGSTAAENTNYHFDVNPDHLREALDRFAQFFVEPLFTAEMTDKELNAVNQEFSRNKQQDMNRISYVLKACAITGHPYRKFTTGNIDSLKHIPEAQGIVVRDEMMKFYKRFYYPENMSLAIIGKESLEELADMVVDLFDDVKDHRSEEDKEYTKVLEETKDDENLPFSEESLPFRVYYSPVKNLRQLRLVWQIPALTNVYQEKPTKYLSHLLGHEGVGSILYNLKKKGLANALTAGTQYECRQFALFGISIDLTEEGLKHKDEIKSYIFSYIDLIRKAEAPRWVFDEIQKVSEIKFKFREQENSRLYAKALSSAVLAYPEDHIISAQLLYSYSQETITHYLSYLTPEKLMEMVISQDYKDEVDKTVRYYECKYKFASADKTILPLSGDVNLNLPLPNVFIPDYIGLKQSESATTQPVLLVDTDLLKVWHHEASFLQPKLDLTVKIYSPVVTQTPYWEAVMQVMVDLVDDKLEPLVYDASLVDISHHISITSDGVLISFNGFDSKAKLMLEYILNALCGGDLNEKRFNDIIEKKRRGYENFGKDQPHVLVNDEVLSLLYDRRWRYFEKLSVLSELTFEDVKLSLYALFQSYSVLVYNQGNCTRDESIAIGNYVLDRLPKPKISYDIEQHKHRVVELPGGVNYIRQITASNPQEANSGILTYYQFGPITKRLYALSELWSELAQEPTFHVLRTKHQLGYIVFRSILRKSNVIGYKIVVQSAVADPPKIDSIIEKFLQDFKLTIENMSDEELNTAKESIITKLLRPKINLSEDATRYYHIITSFNANFNFAKETADVIRSLSKSEILEFVEHHFLPNPSRRKISVHFHGNQHKIGKVEDYELISDVTQWKLERSLYHTIVDI